LGSGCNSSGEGNYEIIESVLKKYLEEKKEDKHHRLECNEHRIALEEKRAEDERASCLMQHEMMMMLISHLTNK
jgi:hypothetical protein